MAYEDDKETIFLLDVKPGSNPRRIAAGSTPTWSPNGLLLAYYKVAAGRDHRQLWVYNVGRRRARQVTNFPGGIDPDFRVSFLFPEALDFSWSPDGRSIAFGSRVGALGFNSAGKDILDRLNEKSPKVAPVDVGKPIVFTTITPYGGTLAGILPGWRMPPPEKSKINQLYVVNVEDGKTRAITRGPEGCATPDWSPDGKSIVCASLEGRETDGYGPPTTNIYVVDPLTGAREAVTSGGNQKLNPRWSPTGQYIAFIEIVGGHAVGGMPLISVVRSSGGPVVRIPDENTQRYDGRRLFQWSPDGESVIFGAPGIDEQLRRFRVRDGQVSDTGLVEKGKIEGLSVSKNGSIAWLANSSDSPLMARIISKDAEHPYSLHDFNPQVKDWQLGLQEVVRWTNRQGEPREGILIKPARFVDGQTYPLIVDPYPFRSNGFMGMPLLGNQAWASQGFAVFFPNPRLPFLWLEEPSVQTQEKLRGAKGWEISVDDVLSGVAELVARSIVDPQRVCLYGMSNGGGAVNYLVTATDQFKCAVSLAGVMSDWPLNALLGNDVANSMFDEFAGGKTIWDDPEDYIRASPVYRLDRIRTPMLLAGGDLDGFVILMNNEMYLGLKRFGRDVTMLRYPNQPHALQGKALEDFWAREGAFFSRHLGPTLGSPAKDARR